MEKKDIILLGIGGGIVTLIVLIGCVIFLLFKTAQLQNSLNVVVNAHNGLVQKLFTSQDGTTTAP